MTTKRSTTSKGAATEHTQNTKRASETTINSSTAKQSRQRSKALTADLGSSYTAKLPQPDSGEYKRLLTDVAEHGVLVPIELDEDGKVLDGVQRLRACQELGLTPPTITRRGLTEAEKQEHALTLNLTRRQLGKQQRQQLHRELRKLGKSNRAIAEASGVSEATVRRDTAGIDGPERIIGKDGKAYPARLSKPVPILDYPEAITPAQQRMAKRLSKTPTFPAVAPPSGSYSVIYADPPWPSAKADTKWSFERHYPTQTIEEIKALPIPAAKDCVLYMWAINGLLPEALEVITAWGFQYQTNIAWNKQVAGLGALARSEHELLIVATKGKVPALNWNHCPTSVITEKRSAEHSRKPVAAYELIEQSFPEAGKIELYARRARKGWRNWGNEAPDSIKALKRSKAKPCSKQSKATGKTCKRSRSKAAKTGKAATGCKRTTRKAVA